MAMNHCLSRGITVGGKLHLTREQWEACQGDGKKGESPPSTGGQAHIAQVEEEEPALLVAHTSIELSPVASAAAALLHLNEPRAHALLSDGSSSDKTDAWCLDTSATHHMAGRRELFT
jgi:hypothetical protein